MSVKQLRKQNLETFAAWHLGGTHEADDDLNDGNLGTIKTYMAENPNAKGYKYHEGIIDLDTENLYNFCCDYIFDGTPENIEKIKAAEGEFKKTRIPENLTNTLDAADGICLVWS